MSTWLVLDATWLCHRAYHALGDLSHLGVSTGVVYGFLRDIPRFQDMFSTGKIAFCFDHGKSLRVADFPAYKKNRAMGTVAEVKSRGVLEEQIIQLALKHLPDIGFRNVFRQYGYEADDLIASVVQKLRKGRDSAIIIAADKDLYQLLSDSVSIWNPQSKKLMDRKGFTQKYGIDPCKWAHVKAIAGCKTDNIPGVPRVGDLTAARYISGQLKPHTKSYQAIEKSKEWVERLKLVQLPYSGAVTPILLLDNVTRSNWETVCEKLGMETLKKTPPWIVY